MASKGIIASKMIHPTLGVVFRTKGGSFYKHVAGPGRMGKRVHLKRGVHPQHGSGFFDSIGNFFTKTLPSVVTKYGPAALDLAKKTGALSKVASFVPGVGSVLSTGLKAVGYGARKPAKKLIRVPLAGHSGAKVKY